MAGVYERPGALHPLPSHQTRASDPFSLTADASDGLSVVAVPLALDRHRAFGKTCGGFGYDGFRLPSQHSGG